MEVRYDFAREKAIVVDTASEFRFFCEYLKNSLSDDLFIKEFDKIVYTILTHITADKDTFLENFYSINLQIHSDPQMNSELGFSEVAEHIASMLWEKLNYLNMFNGVTFDYMYCGTIGNRIFLMELKE